MYPPHCLDSNARMPPCTPLFSVAEKSKLGAAARQQLCDAGDSPMAIIASIGPQRTGKSFRLDYLFKQLGGGERMFDVRATDTPVTQGIDLSCCRAMLKYLCSQWKMHAPDVDKAVGIVDTEGSGDNGCGHDAFNGLVALLIADLILFTVKGSVEVTTFIESVYNLANLASYIGSDDGAHDVKLGHLHVVVTDYSLEGTPSSMFRRVFEEGHKNLRDKRKKIVETFVSIEFHLLPPPLAGGRKMPSCLGETDLSPDYSCAFRSFAQSILFHLTDPTFIRGSSIPKTGESLSAALESYLRQCSDPETLKLTDAIHNVLEAQCSIAADRAFASIDSRIDVAFDNLADPTMQHFQQAFQAVVAETVDVLRKSVLPEALAVGGPFETALKPFKDRSLLMFSARVERRLPVLVDNCLAVFGKLADESVGQYVELNVRSANLDSGISTVLLNIEVQVQARIQQLGLDAACTSTAMRRWSGVADNTKRFWIRDVQFRKQQFKVEDIEGQLKQERLAAHKWQEEHSEKLKQQMEKNSWLTRFFPDMQRTKVLRWTVTKEQINNHCRSKDCIVGEAQRSHGFDWYMKFFPNGSGVTKHWNGTDIPNGGFVPMLWLFIKPNPNYQHKEVRCSFTVDCYAGRLDPGAYQVEQLARSCHTTQDALVGGHALSTISFDTMRCSGVSITVTVDDVAYEAVA